MTRISFFSKLGVCSMVIATSLFSSSIADASSDGLLALFAATESKTDARAIEDFTSTTGCSVKRQGKVLGTDGPLSLSKVSAFAFLECEAPLLTSKLGRSAIGRLSTQLNKLVMLEGDARWAAENQESQVKDRTYIIKISRFNNRAPDARQDELAAIGAAAASRAHAYQDEAVIAVRMAWGMPTVDDVTLLYYSRTEDGDLFRKQNPDIMKMIGAFNKAHLESFAYGSVGDVR